MRIEQEASRRGIATASEILLWMSEAVVRNYIFLGSSHFRSLWSSCIAQLGSEGLRACVRSFASPVRTEVVEDLPLGCILIKPYDHWPAQDGDRLGNLGV